MIVEDQVGTCLQHSYIMLAHLEKEHPEIFEKAKLCQGALQCEGEPDTFHCWIEAGAMIISQAHLSEYESNFIKESDGAAYRYQIDFKDPDGGEDVPVIFVFIPRSGYYGKNDDGIALVKCVRRWSAKEGLHQYTMKGFNAFTKRLDKLHRSV